MLSRSPAGSAPISALELPEAIWKISASKAAAAAAATSSQQLAASSKQPAAAATNSQQQQQQPAATASGSSQLPATAAAAAPATASNNQQQQRPFAKTCSTTSASGCRCVRNLTTECKQKNDRGRPRTFSLPRAPPEGTRGSKDNDCEEDGWGRHLHLT